MYTKMIYNLRRKKLWALLWIDIHMMDIHKLSFPLFLFGSTLTLSVFIISILSSSTYNSESIDWFKVAINIILALVGIYISIKSINLEDLTYDISKLHPEIEIIKETHEIIHEHSISLSAALPKLGEKIDEAYIKHYNSGGDRNKGYTEEQVEKRKKIYKLIEFKKAINNSSTFLTCCKDDNMSKIIQKQKGKNKKTSSINSQKDHLTRTIQKARIISNILSTEEINKRLSVLNEFSKRSILLGEASLENIEYIIEPFEKATCKIKRLDDDIEYFVDQVVSLNMTPTKTDLNELDKVNNIADSLIEKIK